MSPYMACKERKRLCFTLLLILLLLVSACAADGEKQQDPESETKTATCTLLIECSSVFEHWDELAAEKQELIPEDGVMLSTQVTFEEGDTVFDVFSQAVQQNKLHADSVVSSDSAYVRGIGNLYETDCGEFSGWMVYINGEMLMTDLASQTVAEGDEIAFRYVCDLIRYVSDFEEEVV